MKISICIATYKREEGLRKLLQSIQGLDRGEFEIEIIITDNDSQKSAEKVVKEFYLDINYDVEPEQNIALARNKCLEKVNGEFVVFIDDDEYPPKRWLKELVEVQQKTNADGVFSMVVPLFEKEIKWVKEFYTRSNLKEQAVIKNTKRTGAGNCLLKTSAINQQRFDPAFGLTGSEDTEFFGRLLQEGCKFVWSQKAIVFENVPKTRTNKMYLFRRAFRIYNCKIRLLLKRNCWIKVLFLVGLHTGNELRKAVRDVVRLKNLNWVLVYFSRILGMWFGVLKIKLLFYK